MVDAQRSFMVDAQRRGNDSSRSQKPTDLTHTGLQLLQLLRLKARPHDAQAAAKTGSDAEKEAADGGLLVKIPHVTAELR
jgi:molybdenum-dependent DNA-binding transcriptional regulator ModE